MESVVVYSTHKSSNTPIFRVNFRPVSFVPAIPASTNVARYVGLNLSHIQPPLPKGDSEELVRTDEWCSFLPVVSSSRTTLEWWDLKQDVSEADALLRSSQSRTGAQVAENWWPGSGRWKIGVKMENADIDFETSKHWKAG